MAEPGLEVRLSTNPEVPAQPYEDKYCVEDRGLNNPVLGQRNHPVRGQSHQSPIQSHAKIQGRPKVILVLAVIVVSCLIAAIGAGLGAGLAAQRKSSPTPASAPIVTQASGGPLAGTESSDALFTTTQFVSATESTQTPTSLSSPICPADDKSTYVATNRPQLTSDATIANTTLSFKIFCYTNFGPGLEVNVQVFTNVSSLSDCLNICALFNFNVAYSTFPSRACTGIALGTGNNLRAESGLHSCWLKSNVSLDSSNETASIPGFHGALLLGV